MRISDWSSDVCSADLLIVTDGDAGGSALSFHDELAKASDAFAPVDTAADDPALLIYTSGTTGPPKGALHAQRIVRGHLPGVEFPHEGFPQPGDLMWTPVDWAWAGGLLDILMPRSEERWVGTECVSTCRSRG